MIVNICWRERAFLFCLCLAMAVAAPAVSAVAPDMYEDDDVPDLAGSVVVNYSLPQLHNFHDQGDEDWVAFFGLGGESYTVEARNPGANADIVIDLFDETGTLLKSVDDRPAGEGELLDFPCPADGLFFARFYQYDPAAFGDGTGYEVWVYRPIGQALGVVEGVVSDAVTGMPVGRAQVVSEEGGSGLSFPGTGDYVLFSLPGPASVTTYAEGYEVAEREISIIAGETVRADFSLNRLPGFWPEPTIRANGAQGSVVVVQGEPVVLNLGLASGERVGFSADWWLVQVTPAGQLKYLSLDTLNMTEGLQPTLQGPLFGFPEIPLLSVTGLEPGPHLFVFGVDLTQDAVVNGPLSFDLVLVNVTSN